MRYLKVRNFERFQHYKARKPPWVKLYRDIWSDRQFFRLKPESKLFLIGLFTIASHTDNEIPDDPEWLAEELHLPIKLIDVSPLIAAGFLSEEERASNMLAERQQLASDLMPSCSVSISDLSDLNLERNKESLLWPDDDLWLKTFIETQQHTFNGTHVPFLTNHKFWDDVSEAVNGLAPAFITAEFAKMSIWLTDNPQKAPTPKGVRRFVAGWLQRAADQERRNTPAVRIVKK